MSRCTVIALLIIWLLLPIQRVGPIFAAGAAKVTSAMPSEARTGGVYRIPLLNDPPRLDPAVVEDIYGVAVVQQIFDGLVQFTPDLFVVPSLAVNWRVEEGGRLYRFFLHPEAKFHNGRKVTSADVVFSLSRLLKVEPPPSILPHLLKIRGAQDFRLGKSASLDGLQAVDELTVTVTLEEPYTPLLTALGMYQAKIVPREEAGGEEAAFARRPVGSGPFRLASREEGRQIRLDRFPDYYNGPAFLDALEFRVYPGGKIEEVLVDFQNGKLEEMPVYAQIRPKLLDKKDLHWVHRPSLSLLFYGINCRHPLLKDPGVRKALAMGVDRQRLVSEVYGNQFEAATTLLPPGMPGYRPGNRQWPYDPEKAKAFFEKTMEGRSDGPLVVEVVSNSQSPLAQAELKLMGDFWRPLGVELRPKFMPDWGAFEAYLKSGDFQIYRYAWFADMPDPDNFLHPLFVSDSQVNFMQFHSNEVDAIAAEARGTIDPIARVRLYQQMEDMIAEASPVIPLFYLSVDRVYHSWVRGVEVSPLGEKVVSYHRVWLEESAAR